MPFVRRDPPRPRRGTPTIGRGTPSQSALRKFRARIGYATRQLRNDCPGDIVEHRRELEEIMREGETTPTRGLCPPPPGLSAAWHFDIASEDNAKDQHADLEGRIEQCENDVRDLTMAICNCPIFDFGKLLRMEDQPVQRTTDDG